MPPKRCLSGVSSRTPKKLRTSLPGWATLVRVEAKLKFCYDREADILRIDKTKPYKEQETEELGDDIIARMNPKTGDVETLELLFFSTHLLRENLFELPIMASFKLAS